VKCEFLFECGQVREFDCDAAKPKLYLAQRSPGGGLLAFPMRRVTMPGGEIFYMQDGEPELA